MQRLQNGVLRAYASRNSFLALITEAVDQMDKDLANLTTSYTRTPVYLDMSAGIGIGAASASAARRKSPAADKFMTCWESIVAQTDTKLTHLCVDNFYLLPAI